jgi:outer membrane immunogenic protein
MRRLSLAFIAAISTMAFTQIASAADLPRKAPAYTPPPPAPVYNWTGFYVGAGGGYGMFNVDNEGITPTGVVNSTNQTAGGRGWFGTVVGGFDYQFSDRFVAGVFADTDFSDIKGRLADTYEEGTAPLKQQWAWGVGGRVGFLVVPTALTYFNGGFTQAHFTGGAFENFNGAPTALSLGSQTFNGWFLGGGIETMLFPGLSLKTEYRFADYETRDIPFNGTTFSGDVNREKSHPFVQTVRTELVYKFNVGGAAAPVANAADLGARPVYKAPPPIAPTPVYNWTGLYLGGGFGYGMFNLDNTGIQNGQVISTGQTAGGRGWFGTVVGGFDYQFNNRIVAGVFADADFSDIKGRLADTDQEETFPVKEQWAWAVGGRVGYLIVPSVLSYFNGGFTQAHFSGGLSAESNGAPGSDTLGSQTYGGWFLGGGVEMMLFPGWSIKTEYRFADYEDKDVRVTFVPSGGIDERIHPFVQTVRTALTYKFNFH